MFLEKIGHGITSFLFGAKEPDKLQQSQIDGALLDGEVQLLFNAIGLYGHIEIEHIYNNVQRLKQEMQRRNIQQLRIAGKWVIKLNAERINIVKY